MFRPSLSVLATLALVACAAEPPGAFEAITESAATSTEVGEPSHRIAGLTLSVSPAVPGDDLVLTVTGAAAFEQIQVARSLAGPGSGPCFGTLSALCLDVAGPIALHATLTTDANGVAVLEQALPETVPIGTQVSFQAVIPRGTSGLNWVKSNVVAEQIVDAPLHAGLFEPGDLRITEVMVDPGAVSDANGEWFEIENVSGLDANLDGVTFSDGAAAHTLSSTTFLADGARLVFGASTNQATNGGAAVDHVWSGLSLANTFGEVAMLDGAVAIDVVGWDDGSSFPLEPGRSLTLAADLDHLDNDLGDSWCSADTVYGAGDRGTPGAANDSCEPLMLHDAQAEITTGLAMVGGFGEWVSSAGDLDGDGFDDLLVSAPRFSAQATRAGSTWVLYGPLVGDVNADAIPSRLDGVDAEGHAGTSAAAVGDVDGDGSTDLLVGAPAALDGADVVGIAYLITDPVLGNTPLSTAHARLIGEADGDEAGTTVAGGRDIDGDGFTDVWVGAPANATNGFESGVVYGVRGPVVGDFDLANADVRLYGEFDTAAGTRIELVGDLTGDGSPDLAVVAPRDDTLASNAGAVYLVDAAVTGDHELETIATAIIRGDAGHAGDGMRVAAAGDVDGDGFADLLIGAPDLDAAYLFNGPVTGERTLSEADVVFTLDDTPNSHVGSDVAGPGDLNGDGFDDLLIGATHAEPDTTIRTGAAYVVYGPVSRDVDLAGVDTLVGPSPKYMGSVVSGAGDLDGDGLIELAAGCLNSTGTDPVLVFSGADL